MASRAVARGVDVDVVTRAGVARAESIESMVNEDRGQSHGRNHAKPGPHRGVLGLEVEVRMSGVDRDARSGGVFREDGVESFRRFRLILR